MTFYLKNKESNKALDTKFMGVNLFQFTRTDLAGAWMPYEELIKEVDRLTTAGVIWKGEYVEVVNMTGTYVMLDLPGKERITGVGATYLDRLYVLPAPNLHMAVHDLINAEFPQHKKQDVLEFFQTSNLRLITPEEALEVAILSGQYSLQGKSKEQQLTCRYGKHIVAADIW
jgi:hypothetical protein